MSSDSTATTDTDCPILPTEPDRISQTTETAQTIEATRKPLWRNREYLLIEGGAMISGLGTQISHLAFPLLVLALTGSPAQAGLVGTLRAMPYLLLALPAGALVDRWNRRTVMLLCDSGRALFLGGVAVALAFNALALPFIYAAALGEGMLGVVYSLASIACLPRVVPKEQLPQAYAWSAVDAGSSSLAGPPLGGLLYALGRGLPFLADAVSYVISVTALFFVRAPLQGERTAPREPMAREIRVGLAWLWRHPTIRLLAIMSGLINIVVPEASALLIIVLAHQQHAPSSLIGLIFAGIGLGYILGSVLVGIVRKYVPFRVIMPVSCWLYALCWGGYALGAGNLVVLAIVSTLFSVADPLYDITQFSYRMALIPDELQGRVNSVYRMIARATPPLGLALTGILLQQAGAILTIAVLGVFPLAMAILATTSRAIRAAPEHGK
ncbi:MAG TPA: MFS transporter [Ktedonobacterales bacterium]|nr:MFS transporter [Ktedonobacterales bacterium]